MATTTTLAAPLASGSSNPIASLVEYLLTPSPAVFILGFSIVFLVPFLLHYLIARATPYTTLPAVLLAGPSGGGKTELVALLERGGDAAADAPDDDAEAVRLYGTHTSQVPHAVELAVSTDGGKVSSWRGGNAGGVAAAKHADDREYKRFLLVDTPGHGKLRGFALAQLLPAVVSGGKAAAGAKTTTDAAAAAVVGMGTGLAASLSAARLRGLVFVVDAASLSAEGTEGGLAAAAAYLYDALLALQKRAAAAGVGGGKNKKGAAAGPVPVLVAANKQDLFTALPAGAVKTQLEAELGRIRESRSRGLLDSGKGEGGGGGGGGGDEDNDEWLGAVGTAKFTFAQLRDEFDIDVDVVAGSVFNAEAQGPGVDAWWRWIAERI